MSTGLRARVVGSLREGVARLRQVKGPPPAAAATADIERLLDRPSIPSATPAEATALLTRAAVRDLRRIAEHTAHHGA